MYLVYPPALTYGKSHWYFTKTIKRNPHLFGKKWGLRWWKGLPYRFQDLIHSDKCIVFTQDILDVGNMTVPNGLSQICRRFTWLQNRRWWNYFFTFDYCGNQPLRLAARTPHRYEPEFILVTQDANIFRLILGLTDRAPYTVHQVTNQAFILIVHNLLPLMSIRRSAILFHQWQRTNYP